MKTCVILVTIYWVQDHQKTHVLFVIDVQCILSAYSNLCSCEVRVSQGLVAAKYLLFKWLFIFKKNLHLKYFFLLLQNLGSQDIYYIFPEWVQTAKNLPLTDDKNKFTFPNGICCHFRFCHDRKKSLLYCSISILGPISSFFTYIWKLFASMF